MYSTYTVFSEIFAVVWIFVLGAAIGSFINVLAYRLPNGKTILGSSFCPRCREEIRFKDNIPILGWILLRGRCRDCQLPISKRYPIIESICAVMVLAIAIPELAMGGMNFPGIEAPRYFGFSWNLLDVPSNLLVLYAGHALLACCLLTGAIIEWDRQRIPMGLTLCVILIAVTITFVNPQLTDSTVRRMADVGTSLNQHDLSLRLVGSLIGSFAGVVAGRCDPIHRRRFTFAWTAMLWWAAIGWCLGALATMSMFVVSAFINSAFRPPRSLATSRQAALISHLAAAPISLLLLAFLIQVLFWPILARLPNWPSSFARFPATWIWLIAATVAWVIVFLFSQRQPSVRQVADRAV